MTSLTIHDLSDDVHSGLRKRAAEHGRSLEAEAREILAATVVNSVEGGAFVAQFREAFKGTGGLGDLELPVRQPPRAPPDFSE